MLKQHACVWSAKALGMQWLQEDAVREREREGEGEGGCTDDGPDCMCISGRGAGSVLFAMQSEHPLAMC